MAAGGQAPMSIAPLLSAAPIIQFHAFAAVAALALGVLQFAAPKGTVPHRAAGWTWVGLMAAMLCSGFFIHDAERWDPFSLNVCLVPRKSDPWMTRCAGIHVITIAFLSVLPYAVLHARRGNVRHHRSAMLALLLGAGLIAGAFTMDTDRIIHAVVFGP